VLFAIKNFITCNAFYESGCQKKNASKCNASVMGGNNKN